jgi:transposase
VSLRYQPWRVDCRRCGVRVERVPWGAGKSRFTYAFEELVAYLAQSTDRTKVSRLLGISWRAVGSIVERVVARKRDPKLLVGLRRIGVDEFSYRKRHRYLTIVVDHDRRCVVWAAEGRSSEILGQFFALLSKAQRRQIRYVTMDMAAGYIEAVKAHLPKAQIVFDRFHVQQLASNAVDEIRRSVVRELRGTEQARKVKNLRFTLLKGDWRLDAEDRRRLAGLQQANKPLFRAYLLKELLTEALECRQPDEAEEMLRSWLSWAARSRLEPFRRVARTVRKHLSGILAYVRTRLTNGLVEGLNLRVRLIARRAFGFHSAKALISMLFLSCSGIELDPPLPASVSS